jgi:hypothetical protein
MARYTLKQLFFWITVTGLALGLYYLDRSLPERIRWTAPAVAILFSGIVLTTAGLILRHNELKNPR